MKLLKNYKTLFKASKGFTLVETLVSLAIVMVGIAAAFGVAQSGVSSSSFVKDRITAFFLAQEAFEAVRSARDHNLLLSNANIPRASWLTGLESCLLPAGCDFDLKATLDDPDGNDYFLRCNDPITGGCRLKYVMNEGTDIQHYGYGLVGSTNSKFTREIFIEEFDQGVWSTVEAAASVRIKVSWDDHEFETVSYIFNWF